MAQDSTRHEALGLISDKDGGKLTDCLRSDEVGDFASSIAPSDAVEYRSLLGGDKGRASADMVELATANKYGQYFKGSAGEEAGFMGGRKAGSRHSCTGVESRAGSRASTTQRPKGVIGMAHEAKQQQLSEARRAALGGAMAVEVKSIPLRAMAYGTDVIRHNTADEDDSNHAQGIERMRTARKLNRVRGQRRASVKNARGEYREARRQARLRRRTGVKAAQAAKVAQGARKGTAVAKGSGKFLLPIAGVMLMLVLMAGLMTMLLSGVVASAEELDEGVLTATEEAIVLFLRDKGLDDLHIAAIMGGLFGEDGYTAWVTTSEGEAGLVRWDDVPAGVGRLTALKEYAVSLGKSWVDLEVQLVFMYGELTGAGDTSGYAQPQFSSGASWQEFLDTTTIEEALDYFARNYLKIDATTWATGREARLDEAERIYGLIGAGSRIVAAAMTQLGVPYVLGGKSPETGFDCSGIVYWAHAQAGIDIPAGGNEIGSAARAISFDELQPGDIVWRWSTGIGGDLGHIGIYVGDGKYLHAPRSGDVVKISSYWGLFNRYATYWH